jgi:hypothetical protein
VTGARLVLIDAGLILMRRQDDCALQTPSSEDQPRLQAERPTFKPYPSQHPYVRHEAQRLVRAPGAEVAVSPRNAIEKEGRTGCHTTESRWTNGTHDEPRRR